MTDSVYSRIAQMKQNKYDKVLAEVKAKIHEIDDLNEKKKMLEDDHKALKESFPARKKAIYDEYFTGDVDRTTFEKIGYLVMVLEHEISAHLLKIKSHDELIVQAKEELVQLEVRKHEFVKVLEKYSILVEIDTAEKKKLAQFREDAELEEFSKKR